MRKCRGPWRVPHVSLSGASCRVAAQQADYIRLSGRSQPSPRHAQPLSKGAKRVQKYFQPRYLDHTAQVNSFTGFSSTLCRTHLLRRLPGPAAGRRCPPNFKTTRSRSSGSTVRSAGTSRNRQSFDSRQVNVNISRRNISQHQLMRGYGGREAEAASVIERKEPSPVKHKQQSFRGRFIVDR